MAENPDLFELQNARGGGGTFEEFTTYFSQPQLDEAVALFAPILHELWLRRQNEDAGH